MLRFQIRIRIVSETFWLHGSVYEKIRGSTDPDPKGQNNTKRCKKKLFVLKTQTLTFENVSLSYVQKSVNLKEFRIRIEMKWILSTEVKRLMKDDFIFAFFLLSL